MSLCTKMIFICFHSGYRLNIQSGMRILELHALVCGFAYDQARKMSSEQTFSTRLEPQHKLEERRRLWLERVAERQPITASRTEYVESASVCWLSAVKLLCRRNEIIETSYIKKSTLDLQIMHSSYDFFRKKEKGKEVEEKKKQSSFLRHAMLNEGNTIKTIFVKPCLHYWGVEKV